MDSVNSGSLQSSSGEGNEFNSSSADSLSAFFRSTAAAALPPPQPPPPSSSVHNHHFFDPISYLDSITSTTPSWPPRALRASHNVGVFPSITTTPSCSSPDVNYPTPVQPPDLSAAAPRSSKKRSRASRRAQTTVLTTDTSNFRAMVQQFTGIPSPPFDIAPTATSSSPFARSLLNVFRSAAAFGSTSAPPPPPFLLRPFQPKVQGSTLTTTTTTVTTAPAICSSSTTTGSNASTSFAATNSTIFDSSLSASARISTTSSSANPSNNNNNYQLPSPTLAYGSKSQPLLSTQNHMLTLQSLLHAKCTKPQIPMPSAEQSRWTNGYPTEAGDRARSSPISAGNSSGSQQGMSSCKLNYLAPGSSECSAEQGSERATASRSEGAMDSWIFSSD
ncbi:unnamed protein product [Musa acuminata subsp. malaccensis]|uniref:(wild Malaysian banana) hypothetical protein n=1 Tax=Musa acuminata subsp. malaccensis TaxID=214687 RepID=A0A804JD21_MUSAM|nr:PREDICTED: uncharacterized protein DDB_G0271670-like [Musa acuminata subsp. malaccensis]CAG1845387.1 unnamed protein product [Musa acuminata subsp. malaccensis]